MSEYKQNNIKIFKEYFCIVSLSAPINIKYNTFNS